MTLPPQLSDDICPESLNHSHAYIVRAGKLTLLQTLYPRVEHVYKKIYKLHDWVNIYGNVKGEGGLSNGLIL